MITRILIAAAFLLATLPIARATDYQTYPALINGAPEMTAPASGDRVGVVRNPMVGYATTQWMPAAQLISGSTVANTTVLRASCTSASGCPTGHLVFAGGITRLTYGNGNRAPPLFFATGAGACSTDDGASCVNSADGNSWLGQFPASGADVREWGAPTDGVTDATSALQAAITATGKAGIPLLLGSGHYLISSSIVGPGSSFPVSLIGNSPALVNYNNPICPTGISSIIVNSNITALLLSDLVDNIRNICFQMATTPGTRTTGAAISLSGGYTGPQDVSNNIIINPFDGIVLTGTNIQRNTTLDHNQILSASDDAVRIGTAGSGSHGNISDNHITANYIVCEQGTPPSFYGSISGTTLTVTDNWVGTITSGLQLISLNGDVAAGTIITGGSGSTWTVNNSQSIANEPMVAVPPYNVGSYGLHIYDTGITYISGNEIHGCNIGTAETPTANQLILVNASGVIGDTSNVHDLLIQPQSSSAAVFESMYSDWWAATAGSVDQPVLIDNSAAGYLDDITFTGGQTHGADYNPNPLVDIKGYVQGITITGNLIYAANGGNTNIGIKNEANANSTVVVTGNSTVNDGNTLAVGIELMPTQQYQVVTGNNLISATVPLMWTGGSPPTADLSEVIANNSGVDDTLPSVNAASSIQAPFNPSFYIFATSPTTVTQMTGYWTGAKKTIIPSGVTGDLSLGGGGGAGTFCSFIPSLPVSVPVEAVYLVPQDCWAIK
jgi:Pectate lyase superfamily protein